MYACTTDNTQYKYSSGSSPKKKPIIKATLRTQTETQTHSERGRYTNTHWHTPSLIAPYARTHSRRQTHTENERPIRNTPTWNPVRSVRFVTKNIFLLSPAFGCCAHRSYGKTVDSVIHTFGVLAREM